MGMPAPGTDPKETRRREQALGYGYPAFDAIDSLLVAAVVIVVAGGIFVLADGALALEAILQLG